jgi:hypothetical protein
VIKYFFFYLQLTRHPFHSPQVIRRLSVLFNNINQIREISEAHSTIGVGPLYEYKSLELNDNFNIVMISRCWKNGTQVAHQGREDFDPSRRKIVLLYQASGGK